MPRHSPVEPVTVRVAQTGRLRADAKLRAAAIQHACRVRRVIELAVPRAVDKALPLVPVEHQDPLSLITGHPDQHPVAPGPPAVERKGDLNRAVAVTGPLPGQRGRVDA